MIKLLLVLVCLSSVFALDLQQNVSFSLNLMAQTKWNWHLNQFGSKDLKLNSELEVVSFWNNLTVNSSDPVISRLKKDVPDWFLPTELYKRLHGTIDDLVLIQTTTKICLNNETSCNTTKQELETKIELSSNELELKKIWLDWHGAVGPKARPKFEEYVKLRQNSSKILKFPDVTSMRLTPYADSTILQKLEQIQQEIDPLYRKLFAYVRRKLRQEYGDEVSENGPIPAHLLGDIFSKNWLKILSKTKPFNESDITSPKTPSQLIYSMGLINLDQTKFFNNSILQKPLNGEGFNCEDLILNLHDSTFFQQHNFFDVRLKTCKASSYRMFNLLGQATNEFLADLNNFTEKGVINKGQQAAIGGALELAASSLNFQGHYVFNFDEPELINRLFEVAYKTLIPWQYNYAMLVYTTSIFNGTIKLEDANCQWWALREKYQGIEPPVNRTEQDFDPAEDYDLMADEPHVNNLVGLIGQFQFFKGLCNLDNQQLINCDLTGKTAAGAALKNVMVLGGSQELPNVQNLTSASLLEYFKPLSDWLDTQSINNTNWVVSKKGCTGRNSPSNSNSTTSDTSTNSTTSATTSGSTRTSIWLFFTAPTVLLAVLIEQLFY